MTDDPYVRLDAMQRQRAVEAGEECAHCGQPTAGYGRAGGERLRHPNDPAAADCYTLVTRDRHPMPCDLLTCRKSHPVTGG